MAIFGQLMKVINDFLNNIFNFIFHYLNLNMGIDKGLAIGFAIILFTILIKLCLLPLNIKQIRSTLRMQEIQPELKVIQTKYKSDPTKLQQETMALYKEKGVNPFAGCLPLLIQWPVLIAMFYVFRNIPNLSGAHFLWIADLSQPHDIPLVILSGLSTYISTSIITPKGEGAQAKQASTMNITMTLLMTFMSYGFNAALVLYWVVSNVFQLGQTLLIRKIDAKLVKANS
ncbi:MAG TPA: membrane protein insertase YidC [Clostridiaceae bacterium]